MKAVNVKYLVALQNPSIHLTLKYKYIELKTAAISSENHMLKHTFFQIFEMN